MSMTCLNKYSKPFSPNFVAEEAIVVIEGFRLFVAILWTKPELFASINALVMTQLIGAALVKMPFSQVSTSVANGLLQICDLNIE